MMWCVCVHVCDGVCGRRWLARGGAPSVVAPLLVASGGASVSHFNVHCAHITHVLTILSCVMCALSIARSAGAIRQWREAFIPRGNRVYSQ